jgi:hypothetical protein
VHHHGQQATSAAFAEALALVDDMYHRSELPGIDELILRLLDTPQPFVQIASTAPQLLAAKYPAAVGLASLLIHPGWVNRATASPSNWTKAAPQIVAAAAMRCRLTDYTYIRLARWNQDGQRPASANHDDE